MLISKFYLIVLFSDKKKQKTKNTPFFVMDSHILLACKHVRMQIRKFCHVVFHFKSYIKEPSFTCVCYNILIVQFPEYGAAVSKFGLIQQVSGGGGLICQAGYHPRKRTFKTHPKHMFFRYENRP